MPLTICVALLQRRLPGNVTGQLPSVGVETIAFFLTSVFRHAHCAQANSLRSSWRLAMSCAPIGMPAGPLNTGIEIAGTCSVVQIWNSGTPAKAGMPTGASPNAAGVSSTSMSPNSASSLLRHSSASCLASM